MLFDQGLYSLKSIIAELAICKKNLEQTGLNRVTEYKPISDCLKTRLVLNLDKSMIHLSSKYQLKLAPVPGPKVIKLFHAQLNLKIQTAHKS